MKTAVYSGSFDPVTKGHIDIIRRAAPLFERLIVAVCANTEKSGGMFSPEERLALVNAALDGEELKPENVTAEICPGMLADFARERGAGCIVRGVRGGAEYEYEAELAKINLEIGGLETIFLPAAPELAHQSSTFARDMILYGRAELALPKGALAALGKIKPNMVK
ncbi:MAG: pantetheine-phosphate adenylyltransferase [Firmicutes bacterium]|nr:pantetheine-phosphate adenylyltransferase [Bacillota bacterium]